MPHAISIDSAAKIAGVIAVIVGVFEYWRDKSDEQIAAASQRSLSYVAEFGSMEMKVHRMALIDYWSGNSVMIRLINEKGISSRAYTSFLLNSIHLDEDAGDIIGAALSISDLFDQVWFCRQESLCNTSILDQFFCDYSRNFSYIYKPLLEETRTLSGSSQLGYGVQRFSDLCVLR